MGAACCGRGDSNLWPLESENCDAQENTMIQRGNLCGVHKFPRWFKYGINNVNA